MSHLGQMQDDLFTQSENLLLLASIWYVLPLLPNTNLSYACSSDELHVHNLASWSAC